MKKPDESFEQPYWVRQLIAFLRRLFVETLPQRATSWPVTVEPAAKPALSEPEPGVPVPLEDRETPIWEPERDDEKTPIWEPEKQPVLPPVPTVKVEEPKPEPKPEPDPEPEPVDAQDSDIYEVRAPHFNNVDGWIASNYRKPFYDRHGKMLPFKGRVRPASREDRTHIGCHITAVEFGTSKRRRDFWLKVIKSGVIPADVFARYDLGDDLKTAERIALHERFWTVPYHVVGLVNGDVLHNNDLLDYTFHGNYLNDEAIGVSAEASLPGLEKDYRKGKHTKVDDFWVQTNRKAFQVAYELAMDRNLPIVGVRCHRQASAGRLGDPSEQYYRLVLRPMAERLRLTIDVDYSVGTGNPICQEWDERGLVDYRGRPLKALKS